MIVDALLVAAWFGCQSLDTVTTYQLMPNANIAEANPLIGQSRARLLTLKVSVNAGMLFAWTRSQRKAIRRTIASTMAVAGCLPGAFNLRHY